MAWIPAVTFTSSDYYNYGDLNRIENNTDYIADYIETFAERPAVGTAKTDWANTDIVFYDDLNRVETNILALKTAIGEPVGWLTPVTDWASLDVFDYNDANRLDGNLSALKNLAEQINAAFLFCGDWNNICGRGNTLF